MGANIRCANPDCRKALHLKEELAGKRVKCPACGQIMLAANQPSAPQPAKAGPSPTVASMPKPSGERRTTPQPSSSVAHLSIGNSVRGAMRCFFQNFRLCSGTAILYIAMLIPSLAFPFFWPAAVLLAAGFAFFSLQVVRGQNPNLRLLFSGFGHFRCVPAALAAVGLAFLSIYLVPILFITEWVTNKPMDSRFRSTPDEPPSPPKGPFVAVLATLVSSMVSFNLAAVVVLFVYCRIIDGKTSSDSYAVSKSIRMALVAPFQMFVILWVAILLAYCVFAAEAIALSLPIGLIAVPFVASGNEGAVFQSVITLAMVIAFGFAAGAYGVIRLTVLQRYDTTADLARSKFSATWDRKLTLQEIRGHIRAEYFGWKSSPI